MGKESTSRFGDYEIKEDKGNGINSEEANIKKSILRYMLNHRKPKIHSTEIAKELNCPEKDIKDVLLELQREFPEIGSFEYSTGWFIQFEKSRNGNNSNVNQLRIVPFISIFYSDSLGSCIGTIAAIVGIIVLFLGLTIFENMLLVLVSSYGGIVILGLTVRYIIKKYTHEMPKRERTQKEALRHAFVAQLAASSKTGSN